MSRRRLQWKQRLIQSDKNLEKIVPSHTKGTGEWLTKASIDGKDWDVSPGTGKGAQVSVPMSTKREQWVRQILASLK